MAVRALILGKLDVPELSSGAMEKENKKMIEMLKTDVNSYFLDAKKIVVGVLNGSEYKDKKRYDVLRSAEFCKKVKDRIEEVLNHALSN